MFTLRQTCGFLAVLSFLFVASSRKAAAQQVWVVEPAGHGHFADIQSAVDAASDGDVILVRPHVGLSHCVYQGFVIQAKSLCVVGIDIPEHSFGIRPTIEVRDLGPAQSVVLANLRVDASGLLPNAGLKLVDCAGAVRVSHLESYLSGNSTAEALWVERCPDVALVGSTLEGGYWPAQAGFWSAASQVALFRCEVEGGYGARPGYLSGDSLLFAQESGIRGGEGSGVDCDQIPPAGGIGAHLYGSASLYTLDSLLLGGDGGTADGYWCSNPTQGPSGAPIVLEDGATHADWPADPRSIDAPDLVFGGGAVPLVVHGLAGDRVFLLEGAGPGFALSEDLDGVALLHPLHATGVELGTVSASEVLEAAVSLLPPPHGSDAIRRFFQLLFEDAGGRRHLGEPWSVVVASEAWGGSCGLPLVVDCNANGVPDLCDVTSGQSQDANENLVPDECEPQSLRIYVDIDATGANDGSTWTDAFVSLDDAIVFAKSRNAVHTEIWVAEGTYLPGTSRSDDFEINERIDWYAGFSGIEQQLDERDPTLHVTTLSGDLHGDDGPNFTNYGDNSYTVVDSNYYGVHQPAIIDGFVITGGSGSTSTDGGGIHASSCTGLILRGCRIVANKATRGGGAYFVGARVEDCVFSGNRSSYEGGGARVYIRATILRCTFADNESVYGQGAGLHLDLEDPCLVEDCVFERNVAPWTLTAAGGAAVAVYGANQRLERCRFVDNAAGSRGGAILAYYGGLQVDNCTFLGNDGKDGGAIWARRSVTITNSVFSGNRAERGGAIFAAEYGADELRVQLSSLSENEAQQLGGGIFLSPNRTLAATNSILWGNRDSLGTGTAAQIYGMGAAEVSDCCIQEFLRGAGAANGNLHLDPRFVLPLGLDGLPGTPDDDLHLDSSSPCIDAGNNALVPAGLALDLDGLPRLVDSPNVPDTGKGSAPLVDMGCYEWN